MDSSSKSANNFTSETTIFLGNPQIAENEVNAELDTKAKIELLELDQVPINLINENALETKEIKVEPTDPHGPLCDDFKVENTQILDNRNQLIRTELDSEFESKIKIELHEIVQVPQMSFEEHNSKRQKREMDLNGLSKMPEPVLYGKKKQTVQKNKMVPTGAKSRKSGFKCEKCSKNFKCESDFRRHIKCHDENPFKCEKCSKGFQYPTDLGKHLRQYAKVKQGSRCLIYTLLDHT